MKQKMKELNDPNLSYMNAAHATWQFANAIKIGDIVFVKKGRSPIIGRGIITSDYEFSESAGKWANIRHVDWTHKGEWQHPGQAGAKTLTDITAYTDYVEQLKALFYEEEEEERIVE